MEFAALKRADWFNDRRLLDPRGNSRQAEAPTNHAQSEVRAMMA